MKPEAQVLKGHLDTLLLASLENGPLHGYAVKEALRDGSGARFDLPTGTIYPALRRLEAAGLVSGTWAEPGRLCRLDASPPHRALSTGRSPATAWPGTAPRVLSYVVTTTARWRC